MTDFSIIFDEISPASIQWNGEAGKVELLARATQAATGSSGGNAGGSGSGSDDDHDDEHEDDDDGPGGSNSFNSANSTYLAWVSLYASTDNRFGAGDILLSRRQVRLKINKTKELELNYSTAGLALAEGSYSLIARIDAPAGVVDTNTANNQSVALVNGRGSDAILTWTSCALNAIQSAGSNGKPGIPPDHRHPVDGPTIHRPAGHGGGLRQCGGPLSPRCRRPRRRLAAGSDRGRGPKNPQPAAARRNRTD